jgi:hypothetical protein
MDFSPTPELIEEALRAALRERKAAREAFERGIIGGAKRMTALEHAMAVDGFEAAWERLQQVENRVTELKRMAGPELAARVVKEEGGE